MPSITYQENGLIAYFNGLRYRKDKKTGYYLHTVARGTGTRLHRDVYEYYNGKIPKGYQIHHKDHDKNNNDISNLEMLTKEQHSKLHGEELTDEQREWRKQNLINKAVPKAREYNLKNRDKEYYQSLYEKSKEKLYEEKEFHCEQCGKTFTAISNGKNRFCSNNCKSKHRRNNGIDNEERVCPVCEKVFKVNKYAKTICCSRTCGNIYRSKNK